MDIAISDLNFIDKNLRELVQWLEIKTGVAFTITSLYRPGDPGVHGTIPLRGIDLRIKEFTLGRCIETLINRHWLYDHERPGLKCALSHNIGTGLHLHLQTHYNTRFFK